MHARRSFKHLMCALVLFTFCLSSSLASIIASKEGCAARAMVGLGLASDSFRLLRHKVFGWLLGVGAR